jgi:mRNA interferase RelE/StbE
LRFGKKSYDELSELQAKQFKQIMMKILMLLKNPFPQDHAKLKGYEHYNSVDSGEYRIIYRVEKESLCVDLSAKGTMTKFTKK